MYRCNGLTVRLTSSICQNDGISAFENGVSNISALGTGGTRILLHRVQNLVSNQHGLSSQVAFTNQCFLHVSDLVMGQNYFENCLSYTYLFDRDFVSN